jgi:PAS domain-containing protein
MCRSRIKFFPTFISPLLKGVGFVGFGVAGGGKNFRAHNRSGERIDHYETVHRRKDGSLIDISLTVSPLKDAAGRVVGASKVTRDISDF